jgi:ribosomal protein L37E
MIDLGSIAGLHDRTHELHAYCHRCDRWSVLDLEAMVRRGFGARRLPLTVRCLRCGEVGTLQVRPPMPARSPTGWIAPPVHG